MKFQFLVLSLLALLIGCSDSSDRKPTQPPSLIALNIEPAYTILDIGSSEHYQALASYSDGEVKNVTGEASWSLESDTGIVELTTEGDHLTATAVMAGQDNIRATFESLSGTSYIEVVEAALVEFTVTPAEAEMLVGYTQAFTAEGRYDDGHTQDLTDESTWSSDNASVASVDSTGLATGESGGIANISASFDGMSSSALVDVHQEAEIESVEVSPQNVTLYPEGFRQFTARVHYDDGSTQDVTRSALWISSDTSVLAQDTFKKGQFNALSVGSAEITAEVNFNYKDTTQVTVEEDVITHIILTPKDFTLPVGAKKRYFTEAVTSSGRLHSLNGSPDLLYEVGDPNIAYVSNNLNDRPGEVTGLGSGTTTITSTYEYDGEVFTEQVPLTVCTGAGCPE
jgi:trimeric autotransporter adhesin